MDKKIITRRAKDRIRRANTHNKLFWLKQRCTKTIAAWEDNRRKKRLRFTKSIAVSKLDSAVLIDFCLGSTTPSTDKVQKAVKQLIDEGYTITSIGHNGKGKGYICGYRQETDEEYNKRRTNYLVCKEVMRLLEEQALQKGKRDATSRLKTSILTYVNKYGKKSFSSLLRNITM